MVLAEKAWPELRRYLREREAIRASMTNSSSRTSVSDPLRIDEIRVDGISGVIGISFCPGKIQKRAISGSWDRNLATDIEAVRDWGATEWVNLLTTEEMTFLGVADLRRALERAAPGIRYHHLSIEDTSVPDHRFEERWAIAGEAIRDSLCRGGKVFIHCKGGLGRSGTVAARLLVELGMGPDEAIGRVRDSRPGAIENSLQEFYVRRVAC